MKTILAFLIACFLVVPTLSLKSQDKKPPPNIVEKSFFINGSDDWINTEIKIKSKDAVYIKVKGTICFHGEASAACVDANGWDVNKYEEDWPNDYDECFDPMKEENHAALIGNLGSEDFFIGTKKEFKGKEGVLYIGINDCSFTQPAELQNTGEFEVFIRVVKPK